MKKYIRKIMENKNIKTYAVVIGLAVLAIALYWVYQSYNQPQEEQTQTENQQTSTENKKTAPTPSVAETISYNEALSLYNDKRIQFDENCVVNPSYATFKKGTKIMLDNRASKQIPVYLDGQLYTLKAYGFKIITLSTTAKLPHTIAIDCGNGKNNGRILLQQ